MKNNASQDDGTKRLRAIQGGNRGKITRLERDATILMREYGTCRNKNYRDNNEN